jgi:hypothetical protein
VNYAGTPIIIVPSPMFRLKTWHHIRVTFDCASDTYTCWVNGTYRGNFTFNHAVAQVTYWEFHTSGVYTLYDSFFYVDAVDFSWDPVYATPSVWQSTITDLEVPSPYYQHILVGYTNGTNTAAHISYRMSDNSSDAGAWGHYNGSTWEAGWSPWTANNMTLQLYGQRYFQVRIWLSTTEMTQTPTVYYIEVKFYCF